MSGGRTAIVAALVAGAIALAGAGISHTGHTDATQPVVSHRSVAAELDLSGDTAVLVAEGRGIRPSDNEQPGFEMNG